MPSSQPRLLSPVHTVIQKISPSSVIDIGIGYGKTGVLIREYMDIMQQRYAPVDWRTKIFGIEVFADYRNPLWDFAYNEVFIADAIDGLKYYPPVDLILALDVWEHFEPAYAQAVLSACLERGKRLLISTPIKPLPQGAVFGNPYEQHVSCWSPRDFRDTRFLVTVNTLDDWIMLMSDRYDFPADIYRHFSVKSRMMSCLKKTIKRMTSQLRI